MASYLRKFEEMPQQARELLAQWKLREIKEADLYILMPPRDTASPGFRRCIKCGKPLWATHAGNRHHVRCLQVKRDALGFPIVYWTPPVVRSPGMVLSEA